MEFTKVDEYLKKLHFSDSYKELLETDKEKAVFTAEELLKDNFRESMITVRAISFICWKERVKNSLSISVMV